MGVRGWGYRRIAIGLAAAVLAAALGAWTTAVMNNEPGSVLLRFPDASLSGRPLLLYSGISGGRCYKFRVHVGSGEPSILLKKLGLRDDCPVELALFTPDRGAYARRLDPTDADDVAWVKAALTAGSLDLDLPSLRQVRVAVWLVVGGADEEAKARELWERHALAAAPVLAQLGAGLELRPTVRTLAPDQITPDCAAVGTLPDSPSRYDDKSLNIYYVWNYLNAPFSSYAMNCWMEGQREIMFVSWDNENSPDPLVAHELGHALGLSRPESVGGHTNGVSGFDAYNLMSTGGSVVKNISLGQSYAMNLGSDSWLKHDPLPGVEPRDCQNSWGKGACPTLKLLKSGWPP